jgi:hypothetical protein
VKTEFKLTFCRDGVGTHLKPHMAATRGAGCISTQLHSMIMIFNDMIPQAAFNKSGSEIQMAFTRRGHVVFGVLQ